MAPTGDIIYYFTPEWGVKFRWWQITTNGSATGPSGTMITDPSGFGPGMATTPGSTVMANSNLYLSVWNFEVAHKWIFGCNCNSWLEMSGGLAYVHMSQSYTLNVNDPVNGTFFSNGSHDFNGFGPTVAFEGHYRSATATSACTARPAALCCSDRTPRITSPPLP